MRYFALVLACLILAACPSVTGPTDELSLFKRVAIACDSYSASLNTASVLRANGKLSAGQIKVVNGVIAVAAPICEASPRPKATLDLLANLEGSVYKILLLIEEK